MKRYNNRGTRFDDRTLHELASSFPVRVPIANYNAGDFTAFVAMYDMEFLGGYFEQAGDEGTNGTVTIEKWDDVSGSTQTAISAAATLDAGAAAITSITALTTTARYVSAGEKVNIVTATVDGADSATVTLWFRLIEFVNVGS